MPHIPATPVLSSFSSSADVAEALADFILRAQQEAVESRGRFRIALSGGSLPKQLSGLIGKQGVKWDRWQVFYADERAVPLDNPDSNHLLCTQVFFSKVPIPLENIHPIDPSLLDDLEELSDAYEQELIREFANKDSARFPTFDLILLGIGPDGHTASLFPNHSLLAEQHRWVVYLDDSPKPPPQRISLSLPTINHAIRVAFVATGGAKKDVLKTILDHPEEGLPASRVRPIVHEKLHNQLYWFVDDAAVEGVSYPKTAFKL